MAVKEKLFFKKRKRIRPEKKRKDKSFSVKYQIENISSFVGYMNSLTTTLLCWVGQKQQEAIYKQKLFSNKTLFLKQSVSQILPTVHSVETAAIVDHQKHLMAAPVETVPT